MSRVLVDTSALLALLASTDEAHSRARRVFDSLRAQDAQMLCSSYVLVETYALVGRRFGLAAALAFRQAMAPLLEVVWVDGELHERGLDVLADRNVADLSLVDAVSFVLAREADVDAVFTFDRHFRKEGLPTLP